MLSDVSALASALSLLTSNLRNARTTLWCCLQLGSSDLPSSCIVAAKHAAELNVRLPDYSLPTIAAWCWKNKLLTVDTVAEYDADICDDNDDDDVFTPNC